MHQIVLGAVVAALLLTGGCAQSDAQSGAQSGAQSDGASEGRQEVGNVRVPRGPMDEAKFWAVIESTRDTADVDAQAAAVTQLLSDLPAGQVEAFQRIFVDKADALLTWRHHHAADLAMGTTSQDVFVSFRAWLVGQGEDAYADFLAEPDSLASVAENQSWAMDGELLEYAADDAYRTITGKQLHAGGGRLYADPAGSEPGTDADSLRATYPRLAERFGTDMLIR